MAREGTGVWMWRSVQGKELDTTPEPLSLPTLYTQQCTAPGEPQGKCAMLVSQLAHGTLPPDDLSWAITMYRMDKALGLSEASLLSLLVREKSSQLNGAVQGPREEPEEPLTSPDPHLSRVLFWFPVDSGSVSDELPMIIKV